jgi:hypothetical protein
MKSIENIKNKIQPKYIILIVLVLILVYLLIKMKEKFFASDTEDKISTIFNQLDHIANIKKQANVLIIKQLIKDLKLVKEIRGLFDKDETKRKAVVIKNIEKLSDTKLVWDGKTLTNKDEIINEILKDINDKYKLVDTDDTNITYTEATIEDLNTKLTNYTNTLDLNDFTENINEYLTEYDNLMLAKTTDLNGIIAVATKENIEKYLIDIFGSTDWGTKKTKSYTLTDSSFTSGFNPITGSITTLLDTPLYTGQEALFKELYKKIFKFEITNTTKLRNVLENYNGDIKLFSELKRLLVKEKEIKSKGQELYEQYALGNSGSSGSGSSSGLAIGPSTPYFNFPDMDSLHKVDLDRHFFWSNYTIEQEFERDIPFPDFTAGNEDLENVEYKKQKHYLGGEYIRFHFPLDVKIILIGSILIEKATGSGVYDIPINLLTPKNIPLVPTNVESYFSNMESGSIIFSTTLQYNDIVPLLNQTTIDKGYYKPLLTNKEDYIIYNKAKEKYTSDTLTFSNADDKYLIVFKKNNMLELDGHQSIFIKILNDAKDKGINNSSNHKVTLNYIAIGGDEPTATIGKLMNLNRNVLQYKYQILTNYLQCKAHGFDPNDPDGKKCNLADNTLGPYDIDSRFVNLLNPHVLQDDPGSSKGMDGAAAMAERDRILDLLKTDKGIELKELGQQTSIEKDGGTNYTVQEIRDIL